MMRALVANRVIGTRVINLVSGKSLGQGVEIKDIPVPIISDDEILVKVHAVALNPTDFKHIDIISPRNSIIGCDYAGEVVKVGKDALGGWKIGDRVAGAVHGGLYHDRGSFAEYLKIDGDLAWKIPEKMLDEEAATYGISAVTAMLALNVHLGIPWVDEMIEHDGKPLHTASEGPTVFVYAASTCAGLFTVQLAKRAGCTVVATASPHSFDLVQLYGADRVFDYRSAFAIQDIKTTFPDISCALDCFSEGNSADFCDQVIKKTGGKVVTLLDRGKSKTPGVERQIILAYTLFGRPFAWLQPIGPKFEARPTDRNALARFYASLPRLTKVVKPPPMRVTEGRFDSILKGLDDLRQGKVSGTKLIVKF